MFNLSIMDRVHGDFTHSWNPADPTDVDKAREIFNNLKKLGYLIYETKNEGTGPIHQVVHDFDSLAASYTFEESKPHLVEVESISLPTEPGALEQKQASNAVAHMKGKSKDKKKEERQLTATPPFAGG
jgi:hypothetical protein